MPLGVNAISLDIYTTSPAWAVHILRQPPEGGEGVWQMQMQMFTKENLINLTTGADFLVKVVTKNYKCLPHLFTKEKLTNL